MDVFGQTPIIMQTASPRERTGHLISLLDSAQFHSNLLKLIDAQTNLYILKDIKYKT